MDELSRLRKSIDECDRELIKVFKKRLNLVRRIIEVKRKSGQSILSPEREKQVIENAKNNIKDDDYKIEAEKFIEQVLKLSRGYMSRKLFPYNIVLTGFMGSGKTAVGNELAKVLEMNYADSDVAIEKEAGMSINKIFKTHGESYFRAMEKDIICRLGQLSNTIIITGGGSVMDPDNVKCLKENGIVVFLDAEPEIIYERIKDDENRPLLNGNMSIETINELYQRRIDTYNSSADIIINTNEDSLSRITSEIINQLYNMSNALTASSI
ncbi:MAG: chorismate mutase [Dethiobacter sp.]|jgi:shikimate kinase|nr:chorismate mutase [Dethiobacter sp.]